MYRSAQKPPDPLREPVTRSHLTLPNNLRTPSQLCKPCTMQDVSFLIPPQFGPPVSEIGPRTVSQFAMRVLVPEAAVHKDHLASAREHQIRTTRKVVPMKPISVSH